MASEHPGVVVQIIGPSVDIRFPAGQLPTSLNAIRIDDEAKGIRLTLEVAQHVGNNTVRCIALDSTDGLVRGMKALTTQRNKIRQASITTEISEIVGTAEALK